jgi:proteasome lid subunit RPN8/RPN11
MLIAQLPSGPLLQAAFVLVTSVGLLWLSCRLERRQWHLGQLVLGLLAELSARSRTQRETTRTRPVPAGGKLAPSGALPAEPPVIRFVLDTLFLAAAWRYLTAMGHNEVFHYVAGVRLARDRYLLTHLIPVAMVDQSPGGVRADGRSSLWALEQLDRWGLLLCGHMHSHPGRGPDATRPSWIDRRFVEHLAAGSYVAIGAICSRDGFFRFYAHDGLPFEVEVMGSQIREVHDHVFHLNYQLAARDLPITIPQTLCPGRGWSGRPARASARL